MSTDWEKELARIDKQLASLSDEKLMAAADAQQQAPAAGKGVPTRVVSAPSAPSPRRERLGLLGRVGLAVVLGAAILVWPYGTACGGWLFAYLGAAIVVGATGVVAAVASWRQRAPVAHIMSLAIVLWSVALLAAQVLPRTGLAGGPATASWFCP